MSAAQTYTKEEVAKHNKADDCWVIIDGKVYDLTDFVEMHPAGAQIILDVAGQDVTKQFLAFHRMDVFDKYAPRLFKGLLAGARPAFETKEKRHQALSRVPFAEVAFWQGFKSPYYNESHKRFRLAVRKFIAKEILPEADAYERSGDAPDKELFMKMGEAGILAAKLGPGKHLLEYKGKLPGGIKASEFDYFHEMILHEEFYRIGAPGLSDGLACGLVIGLPPVIKFGSKELQRRIVPGCLSGEKRICLAITEPAAGSDVSGVQCRAVKSPCGTYYTVTGVKKWITNGHQADYFSCAVRTGGKGTKGVSLLLIERGPGVTTKKIPTNYSSCAGTSLVILENVKVPVANLLGPENQGFKCIMHNFNHERWFISVCSCALARKSTEEAVKWVMQRRAFSKRLMKQPAVRQRLAEVVAQLEAGQCFLEHITYQMQNLSYEDQNRILGGPLGLLKTRTSKMNQFVQDECVQLMGGRGLTTSGMGKIVNRIRAASQYNGILGGTNEVLSDFAMRMLDRAYPRTSKL